MSEASQTYCEIVLGGALVRVGKIEKHDDGYDVAESGLFIATVKRTGQSTEAIVRGNILGGMVDDLVGEFRAKLLMAVDAYKVVAEITEEGTPRAVVIPFGTQPINAHFQANRPLPAEPSKQEE